MKRNKLLFPLLTSLAITPVITVCSCGEQPVNENTIAEWIIKPSESTQPASLPKATFKESLKSLSSKELTQELVYDLFGLFNIKGKYNLKSTDSFGTLYRNKIVGIKTNITNWKLEFNTDNKLMVDFLGYVSFVFTKDYESYKVNDYVMLTFDIRDQEVELLDDYSLKYSIKTTYEKPCVGFAKIRHDGGKELMQYIETIETNKYTVKNSKNWVKTE